MAVVVVPDCSSRRKSATSSDRVIAARSVVLFANMSLYRREGDDELLNCHVIMIP